MTTVRIKVPNWLDRIFTLPLLIYRHIRYGHPFRRIFLGEGLWTVVEPQDYYTLSNFNWYFGGNNGKFYAVRNIKDCLGKIKMVSMHREIMNCPKGLFVDHKNGNSLDNRRCNLRLATSAQNGYNRRRDKSKTSSPYNGVYFMKSRNLFTGQISAGGKRYFLGYFKTEIEAAKAYDRAAKKYHGEFAKLNFPSTKTLKRRFGAGLTPDN